MSQRRVSASATKAEFFNALQLSESNDTHRQLYSLMKEEAARRRQRMSQNAQNLAPQIRHDPTIGPPYSSTQISETAMHREVLNIYQTASPTTRPYYEMGRERIGPNEDNWVIRWLLWHVFRYRDNRNRNRPTETSARKLSSPQSHGVQSAAAVTAHGKGNHVFKPISTFCKYSYHLPIPPPGMEPKRANGNNLQDKHRPLDRRTDTMTRYETHEPFRCTTS